MQLLLLCVHPLFFVHLPVGGHLGDFLILAVVNRAIRNIEEEMFLWESNFVSFVDIQK